MSIEIILLKQIDNQYAFLKKSALIHTFFSGFTKIVLLFLFLTGGLGNNVGIASFFSLLSLFTISHISESKCACNHKKYKFHFQHLLHY